MVPVPQRFFFNLSVYLRQLDKRFLTFRFTRQKERTSGSERRN